MTDIKTFTKVDKRQHEIADSIIRKLKTGGKKIPSKDPNHKNGVKYSIPKEEYDYILYKEMKKIPEKFNDSVREIIDRRLIPV